MNTPPTQVQVQQRKHFWLSGTIGRTSSMLQQIARPSYGRPNAINITALEQRILDAAVYVLQDIASRNLTAMRNLPSKKNLKQRAKNAEF